MDPFKVNIENHDLGKSCDEEDKFWPLSGAPYFSVILQRSHVKPIYHMTVPVKIHKALSHLLCPLPITLTYCGKKWNMNYVNKRFDPKWKEFAFDNNLKAGDACVFEITKRSSTMVEFKVQILRGDIPSALFEKEEGETMDDPIRID